MPAEASGFREMIVTFTAGKSPVQFLNWTPSPAVGIVLCPVAGTEHEGALRVERVARVGIRAAPLPG